MALTLKTNVIANTVRRNLNQHTNAQSSTNNRLSTGRRINQAKDDAAGLAISERFTSQIRGLNQAIRNANDGISLAQVGESALSKLSGGLQRIRELAIQASNDTLSAGDRQNIQAEVDQITAGIRDVVLETEFNGIKLFSEEKSLSFQVGANQGQMIEISTTDLTTSDPYKAAKAVYDAMAVYVDGLSIHARTNWFDGLLPNIGIIEVHDIIKSKFAPPPPPPPTTPISNDVPSGFPIGYEFNLYDDTNGEIIYQVIDAGNETITIYPDTYVNQGYAEIDAAWETLQAGFAVLASGAEKITTQDFIDAVEAKAETFNRMLGEVDLSTRDSAQETIASMDADLDTVSAVRAEYGAFQNRMESAIANAHVASNNMSASRSRIEDADFAKEAAELTRIAIQSQAGISVLTQANAMPQMILSLLQ